MMLAFRNRTSQDPGWLSSPAHCRDSSFKMRETRLAKSSTWSSPRRHAAGYLLQITAFPGVRSLNHPFYSIHPFVLSCHVVETHFMPAKTLWVQVQDTHLHHACSITTLAAYSIAIIGADYDHCLDQTQGWWGMPMKAVQNHFHQSNLRQHVEQGHKETTPSIRALSYRPTFYVSTTFQYEALRSKLTWYSCVRERLIFPRKPLH